MTAFQQFVKAGYLAQLVEECKKMSTIMSSSLVMLDEMLNACHVFKMTNHSS